MWSPFADNRSIQVIMVALKISLPQGDVRDNYCSGRRTVPNNGFDRAEELLNKSVTDGK